MATESRDLPRSENGDAPQGGSAASSGRNLEFEVVIAGGGFAGIYAARALEKAFGAESRRRVALIADQNFMVFQPMLAEVVGSSLSPRHVVNPIRRLCSRVTVLRGEVQDIDLERRLLKLRTGDYTRTETVSFGHLALSLGSIVDLSRVPGMAEHAYVLKNVGDALALRAAIIDRLEEANYQSNPETVRRLLTFVVVGGGYSGVETAGQINDLIEGINRMYPRIAQDDFRVVLVHSREHLLPEVGERLARYCEETLSGRGIELRLNVRLAAMTASRVVLSDGTAIDTNTVISTVGNAPHPLLIHLCETAGIASQKGRLVVDETLRVKGQERLWAAGDCAAVPISGGAHEDQRSESTAPPTAQFALREGALMGANIARAREGKPLKAFTFQGLGELAAIGHRSAVAEILGMKFSGFIAWFLWRTIYLAKLPGIERKLRVVIDWTLDLFFPRDITLLRPRPTDILQEMHFESDDKVFDAGEPALSLYIVKSGRIELRDEGGIVRSLGAGEHFGERALLHDKIWRFTAIAREPTELVALSADVFNSISRASPSIHRFFENSATRFISRRETDSLVAAMPAAIKDMRVGDLMHSEVVSMRPSMTLREALKVMVEHPYNSFPVTDDEEKNLGLLSQADIYNALKREDITLESALDALSYGACATVSSDSSVREAVERFYRSGRNKLLIVDDRQRVQGILTPIDLLTPRTGIGATSGSEG